MSSACDRPVQACILPLAHAQLAYCPEPEKGLRRYEKYEHLQLLCYFIQMNKMFIWQICLHCFSMHIF